MITQRFTLPWPPSANARLTVARGRIILSAQARGYLKAVNDSITVQGVRRHALSGKLAIRILAAAPDNGRRHDLDNVLKCTLDCLKKAGVIEDDFFFDVMQVARAPSRAGGELDVQIDEIPGGATKSAAFDFEVNPRGSTTAA